MVGRSRHRSELEKLEAEIAARPKPEAADPPPEAGVGGSPPEASILDDLRRLFEDGAADAREAAAEHPVAAIAAAFLLGVVVGRLWRPS